MSDDVSAGPAAALPPTPSPPPPPPDDTAPSSHRPAAHDDASARVRLRERAFAQRSKKTEFLVDILRNLDLVIYAELSVLYYMEYVYLSLPLLLLIPSPAASRAWINSI